MWIQSANPLDSIALSAVEAVIPILLLFYLLAVRRQKGHVAAMITLTVAVTVAVIAFRMPIHLALLSAGFGAINGLFPIGWIVLAAVFLYNLSVESGGFKVVKDVIGSITEDRRIQALLIAFCFGAFLEGAAGFGAPVAITAGMLVGLGFDAFYAASLCLISNTAPVAFGGIGVAVITAGKVSGIDPNVISTMIAHQLPFLAFLVPFWLVAIMSGWKGIKEILPAILVTSTSYSLTLYFVATRLGPMLPDILSSMVSIICLILLLKVWQPATIWRFPHERHISISRSHHSFGELVRAWTPFVLLITFVGEWGVSGIKIWLDKLTHVFAIHGLNKMIEVNGAPMAVTYSFGWLSAAGTAIILAALISAIMNRTKLKTLGKVFLDTLVELRFPLLTIACVLGFAYLANYSGMAAALGAALTATGVFFPFLSPFLGWTGVFLTGSDTSSNALFANAQRVTAQHLGINPVLTVAANSTGGVAAKMISPQSIAVATASVKLTGQEGMLFRFTLKHSLAFVVIIGIITFLQAHWLKGMVPAWSAGVVTAAKAMATGKLEAVIVATAIGIILLALLGRQTTRRSLQTSASA